MHHLSPRVANVVVASPQLGPYQGRQRGGLGRGQGQAAAVVALRAAKELVADLLQRRVKLARDSVA
eukprot:1001796-Pyramimonas_sp.AAC.2